MMLYSLRLRLLLTFLGIAVLATSVVALFANRRTTSEFTSHVARSYIRDQQLIGTLLEPAIERGDLDEARAMAEVVGRAYGRPIVLADPKGDVIISSAQLESEIVTPPAFFMQSHPPIYAFVVEGAELRFPVQPEAGVTFVPDETALPPFFSLSQAGFASASLPVELVQNSESRFLGSVNQSFWLGAVLAVAFAGLFSVGLSRRIFHRVAW